MPLKPEDCANYAINLQMCPCTNEGCPNRGICCECVKAHAAAGKPNACNRGTKRDPDTMKLAEKAVKCTIDLSANQAFCPCPNEACTNHAVCCDCVRNHFNVEGTGRVACMRPFA